MPETESITIPEAIGFWQKNRGWIIPGLAALGGIIGGSQGGKVGDLIPPSTNEVTITKRVDDLEVRVTNLEKSSTTTSPDNSGIIHFGK